MQEVIVIKIKDGKKTIYRQEKKEPDSLVRNKATKPDEPVKKQDEKPKRSSWNKTDMQEEN